MHGWGLGVANADAQGTLTDPVSRIAVCDTAMPAAIRAMLPGSALRPS